MQLTFASYSSFKVITPSDTAPITCRAIYVGGAGAIALSPDLTTAATVLPAAVAGDILPIELNQGRVLATGTVATPLIALL